MPAPFTAQQTLDRARTVMQSGRGAALPELLKIIESLSLNICEVTIPELAELIEKDAVVLARIISVANTLAHNPGIAPLTTLSQAIHQLGYNRIRTIAVSLMLLDTAGESNPPEQREAAAHALCAGLIAQGTAEWLGTHDPEFAFACTTLRNFGRIIFAAISPLHCRAAARRTPVIGEAAAYRALFGVTPIEFTRALLSATHLPAEVLQTLRECEPETLEHLSTTHDARMFGIVEFGTRLANIALGTHQGPDGFVSEMRALAQRFDALVPGAPDIAKPALQRTDERLRNFTRSNGSRSLPPKSLARIALRLRQLSPSEVAPTAHDGTAAADAPAAPSHETAPPTAPARPRTALPPVAAETPPPWDASLAESEAFESRVFDAPPDPVLNALKLARVELSAQECWIFRPAPDGTGLSFSCGLGHAFTQLPAGASVVATERSVFGICLQRQEIVLIHDTSDAALVPYLPLWFRKTPGAPQAFSLIPLRAPDGALALLLVGWGTPRRIAISPAQITLVRHLLSAVHTPRPAHAAA
ncbi:MAG: HDOD domain-containing protein [Verrucomicrobia bacterium]|nr:HDOD domain-containing protein [Verrucomicrobiota bacterium]